MKRKLHLIINFTKSNWFRLVLLAAIFWFLLILQNGLEIQHKGWIENESPGILIPEVNL